MKITTEEIRKITTALCKHLDESGYREIDLPQVVYWSIGKDAEWNPYEEPTTHTLGDLGDDWSELKKMIDGTSDPVGHGFVWLAPLLRAVGQNVKC